LQFNGDILMIQLLLNNRSIDFENHCHMSKSQNKFAIKFQIALQLMRWFFKYSPNHNSQIFTLFNMTQFDLSYKIVLLSKKLKQMFLQLAACFDQTWLMKNLAENIGWNRYTPQRSWQLGTCQFWLNKQAY
jgi:hypothetical protein